MIAAHSFNFHLFIYAISKTGHISVSDPARIRSFPSRILDQNFFHPGSRIRIKEFEILTQKIGFLSPRKYDPGCSFRIRIRNDF